MNNKYRDELVQVIKDIGQEIIDRAESMVGQDVDMITDFGISVDIPQPMDGPPQLTWSTSVLVKNFYNRIEGQTSGRVNYAVNAETVTIERKNPGEIVTMERYYDPLYIVTTYKCPKCGHEMNFDGNVTCPKEDAHCPICKKGRK